MSIKDVSLQPRWHSVMHFNMYFNLNQLSPKKGSVGHKSGHAGNGVRSQVHALAHAFNCQEVRFIACLKQSITRYCKMTNIALCYFDIILQLSINGDYPAVLCSKINIFLVLTIPLK